MKYVQTLLLGLGQNLYHVNISKVSLDGICSESTPQPVGLGASNCKLMGAILWRYFNMILESNIVILKIYIIISQYRWDLDFEVHKYLFQNIEI